LGQLVRPLLKPLAAHYGQAAFSLFTEWPAIVGNDIARRCHPIKLEAQKRTAKAPRKSAAHSKAGNKLSQGRVLQLGCESAEALTLSMEAPFILERINRYFGYAAIARLRFVHGKALTSFAAQSEVARPMTQEDKALDFATAQLLSKVENPFLRQALTSWGTAISAESKRQNKGKKEP